MAGGDCWGRYFVKAVFSCVLEQPHHHVCRILNMQWGAYTCWLLFMQYAAGVNIVKCTQNPAKVITLKIPTSRLQSASRNKTQFGYLPAKCSYEHDIRKKVPWTFSYKSLTIGHVMTSLFSLTIPQENEKQKTNTWLDNLIITGFSTHIRA